MRRPARHRARTRSPASPRAREEQERRRRRARRAPKIDATGGRDPLALINKGEMLLLPAEMVDISRPDDDEDDPEAARKAARGHGRAGARPSTTRRAASRLRMELDLPAEAPIGPRRSRPELTYPEWDYRRRAYLPRPLRRARRPGGREGEDWRPDPTDRRRIRLVRRQLRGAPAAAPDPAGQLDGGELDTAALVRSRADLRAGGYGSDRVYLAARNRARDLAVAVLVDVSLSTDSRVEGRRVLDVEKEALTAFAFGLRGLRRRVRDLDLHLAPPARGPASRTVKEFDGAARRAGPARIAALRPGAYTRMGAALRHATRASSRRARTAPPAAPALGRQAERPRPLRGPLRRRGHPHGDPGGAGEGPSGVRRHGRPAGRGLRALPVRPRRLRHLRPSGRLPEALPAIYRQLVG